MALSPTFRVLADVLNKSRWNLTDVPGWTIKFCSKSCSSKIMRSLTALTAAVCALHVLRPYKSFRLTFNQFLFHNTTPNRSITQLNWDSNHLNQPIRSLTGLIIPIIPIIFICKNIDSGTGIRLLKSGTRGLVRLSGNHFPSDFHSSDPAHIWPLKYLSTMRNYCLFDCDSLAATLSLFVSASNHVVIDPFSQ